MSADDVLWHDLECGTYVEDLALWRDLAAEHGPRVLDVGAGTGRTSLDLAAHGFEVTALDLEAPLLAALERRAAERGLRVRTVCADAASFDAGGPFDLVVVPMQTLQLLPGPEARAGFYAGARRHLPAGGVLAAALADALDGFDEEHTEPPLPDVLQRDGWLYASRPVALREHPEAVTIERIRETVSPAGARTVEGNEVVLQRLSAAQAAEEAESAGFEALEQRVVPQTDEYVGSQVVVLRAA